MGSLQSYGLLSVGSGLMLRQPYPANLMVGFYATGDSSQPVRVDLDKELEGAYCPYILALA